MQTAFAPGPVWPDPLRPDPLRPGARKPRPAGPPPTARRPLTVREGRFVQEYLIDLNARAAARRAGYKCPSGTPGKVLQRPEVRLAVQSAMDDHAARLDITRDDIV